MNDTNYSRVREALATPGFFSALAPVELDHLATLCTLRHLPAGAAVFREGDPGQSMFVMVSGPGECPRQLAGRRGGAQ